MSMTFTKESDDLFVICIKGVFTFNDQKEIEMKARAKIDHNQKAKLLVLAEQFAGWGKEGDWGDLTFMYEYDPSIEKIAVVAEERWKDQILMHVGAGRRQALVKFFFTGKGKDAREWLQNKN